MGGGQHTRTISVDDVLAGINATIPPEADVEPEPYTPARWITADVMADNCNAAMRPEPRR